MERVMPERISGRSVVTLGDLDASSNVIEVTPMVRREKILVAALLAGFFATGFSGAVDPRDAIGGVTDSFAGYEGPVSARVLSACPWTYCTATPGNKAPVPAPAGRLEFPGFSIQPPSGEGWSLMSPQEALHFGYDALFVKNISPAGSVHAYATAHRTATSFMDPAEILKASVEQFIKPGGRLLKTSTDRLSGASCVRWEKSQNAGTASLGDKSGHGQIALVSRYHGYLCSHPDAPAYVVEIGYFETVPKRTRGLLTPGEGGSFIKALAFTSLDVKVSQFSAGHESRGLALGYDALWVTEEGAGMVSRIDPENGAVVARIPVGKRPEGFTIGLGAIWVPN
jgi:YVTN family beta-propeller protein